MVVMQRELDRSVRSSLAHLLGWIGGVMALVCLLMVGLSWQQQQSLRTVFDDRVVPLHELQRIGHTLNVSMPAELDSAVVDDEMLKRLVQRQREGWQRYLATYLTEEEQLLARRTGLRLEAALEAARAGKLEGYLRALHAFNIALAPLLDLQVRVAQQELDGAQRLGQWAVGLALGCALTCGLLLWRVWHLMKAQVVWPVRVVADALATLSDGGTELGPEARALSGDFAEVGEHLRQLQFALGEGLSRPPLR